MAHPEHVLGIIVAHPGFSGTIWLPAFVFHGNIPACLTQSGRVVSLVRHTFGGLLLHFQFLDRHLLKVSPFLKRCKL